MNKKNAKIMSAGKKENIKYIKQKNRKLVKETGKEDPNRRIILHILRQMF